MTAPFKKWTVMPHGQLTQINERLITVVGEVEMPLLKLPRRMTAVRLKSGGLIIFSAVALLDHEMAELEAFGQPKFLVVPSVMHRLDAPSYAQRYPNIIVVAPSAGAQKIGEVGASTPARRTSVIPVCAMSSWPATRCWKSCDDGVTLVVNDLIGDIHGESGVGGWLLRVMGFAGDEPHVPAPVKLLMGKHKSEVAAQFRRWADNANLRRIIVSHGDPIVNDPRAALRTLAASLE
ncbi:MAG: hypothetical protein QM757_00765 [Paludibaculum sp.]